MMSLKQKKSCCGCQGCVNVCPKNCISMETDSEGFLYPIIDNTTCIKCGLCEKVCPFNKYTPLRKNRPTTYAAKIKNDEIRCQSSSGGIFSILASEIIKNSGIVYGVSMSEDLKSAKHIRIDKSSELYRLRGSKYLQSITGDIYRQVQIDLQAGKKVLFSGVPCQINGLKYYLKNYYENLLTIEVICHGTPSPALWSKYFDHLENIYNAKIQYVNFREKKNGWRSFGLEEKGDNISQYLDHSQDPYMQMFLRNYCLRPSCYDCVAKKLESMADITIADFWGIQNVVPEMDDDKGTSLILVQTKKGEEVLDSIKEQFISKKVDFENGIKSNTSYWMSCKKPNERNHFFDDMNSMPFENLQAKYLRKYKNNLIKRIIGKVKKTLNHRNRAGGGQVQYSNTPSQFEYGLLVQLKKNGDREILK